MSSSWEQKSEDLKIFAYFFKPHKAEFVFVLGMMLVVGILESLNLAAFYPIMNYGLKLESPSHSLKFLDSLIGVFGQQDLFLSSCIFLMVTTVVSTIAKVIFQYTSSYLITKIVADNQRAIFDKFLNADYKFFVKSQQGRLIYAGTVAPIGVSNNIFYAVRLINSALTCLFFVGLLTLLAWQGMVLMIGFGVLYVIFIRGILKNVVNQFSHLTVDEDRKKNIILNEFITGIKSIKAFANYSLWKNKYADAVNKSAFYNFKVLIGRALPDSFLKFMFFMAFAAIGIALNIQHHGNILPLLPILGTFAVTASRLVPYMNLVGNDIVAIARFMPDTKIVYNTLHESMKEMPEGTNVLKEFRQNISFDRVRFRYEGMEDPLLKSISFSIPKKKVTAIVGPSGSGKSTIVHLLLRLYDVEDGAILIDGQDIRELTTDSYLSKIGYVSQETFIFNGTIKDNIRFGDEKVSDVDVIEAARLAYADEFIAATEHGYNTIVGDAGVKLSGGQRQRIAIARAMLRKPEIIVFDEATSSLDNISERAVQKAIETISLNTTVLVVAHRLSTVQNADQIVVMEHGQVMETGTHQDLLQKENIYSKLYKSTH